MDLIRNTTNDGSCKYALIRLDKIHWSIKLFLIPLFKLINKYIELGEPNSSQEFFVVKLKDKFAKRTLLAYADAAQDFDKGYSDQVRELAERSGNNHKECRTPD